MLDEEVGSCVEEAEEGLRGRSDERGSRVLMGLKEVIRVDAPLGER